jgi:alpha-amylase
MACDRAYEPFLKVLERYPEIPVVMHYSGSLLEWVGANRPELFERIAKLAGRGQIELLGGGFYEPILGMLPADDCVGQIREYRDWLNARLNVRVRGIWLAERMWEQHLVRSMAEAEAEYTVLDDTHFKYAGLSGSELYGFFPTRYDKATLNVFPCSEVLRYAIPFQSPAKTIEHLRGAAEAGGGDAVMVYADDGEKFGLWPNTFKRVYRDGWLERFFDALRKNSDWIRPATLSWVVDNVKPGEETGLPSVSYREMMEWAVDVDADADADAAPKADTSSSLPSGQIRMTKDGLADRFIRGGSWRNFLTKYPEANQMYARMLEVSKRVASGGKDPKKAAAARRELYRAQCNDAYWHGIFGGLYLPHLRRAVFGHLLRAEIIVDDDSHKNVSMRVEARDYDLDGLEECKLTGPRLNAYFKPSRGGHLYELDYRPKEINLLNTLARREEAYLKKFRSKDNPKYEGGAESIHLRRPEAGNAPGGRAVYDGYQKESLIDHFFTPASTLADFVAGRAEELGDFVTGPYTSDVRLSSGKATLKMERSGALRYGRHELPLRVTKLVEAVESNEEEKAKKARFSDPSMLVSYRIENLSGEVARFAFGVEFNLSMSAGKGPGRNYLLEDGTPAGNLGKRCNLQSQGMVTVLDEELGLAVRFEMSPVADVWVCPVETVSRSEAELERVYQCSTILPKWDVALPPGAEWQAQVRQIFSETTRD